jgi:hypothetical protein
MAKEPTKGSQQSAAAKLKYAAATVHTYESFGRAVVASALAQAAKNAASGKQSAITATVNVAPIAREGAAFDEGAGSAAGGAAKGPVTPPPPAVTLTICFGSDCYVISI